MFDTRAVALKLNGEATYWVLGRGEVMFDTLEKTQQAAKRLRRLSRGQPKFVIRKTTSPISHYPKMAQASIQIQ